MKAYLFGSQLKGNVTPNSDIDILVELDHTSPVGLQFVEMQLDHKEILNQDVDLVTTESLSKFISPKADREKELIYER